ncbi:class I SAM-dependent methyltransferase [Mycolicibacterium sp. 018/SC-01/001]|uniref:class I SAM-dependent methyltransferase n=1 Tax=Mycolicibacterium sp. 018/SC-01/001 TaxID=2592069 RepID=UPI00117FBAD2|nr:class I SAM-dependent methyltransferase [Mycolicibacterium sp. 018/SC-01/001]TRW81718.1 class I SAM-dependent methyltransferase [Mycolicibacterium sp. 018/SC-01/001]
MARIDGDRWDLASSVGATATMVAAARAVASREPDPLIDDPFAAALVRAVGIDFFTKLVDGELTLPETGESAVASVMTDVMAVRTKFFDDFFTDAAAAGIRQAVILASGLDSRAYRLNWPDGTVVFEIDQPEVLEFKDSTLAEIGAHPSADRRAVAVDLRDDWPAALRTHGFDPREPTAWSAEGLLVYLPPEAQDRLFDAITDLSAPGSRLATEYHPDAGASLGQRSRALREQWRAHDPDGAIPDLGDLVYSGERNHPADYLAGQDWTVSTRTRPEVFAAYGRHFDGGALDMLKNSLALTAVKS